jgi:tetratricopeptide (TPR) repeat protein
MSRARKERRAQRSVLQPVETNKLPGSQPALSMRPHALRLLALWALAAAAYANSFRSGMVLDNALVILRDPRIRAATAQNIGLILSKDYWYGNRTSVVFRPLATFSYLVNWAIFGNAGRPAGYHVVNFALHAGNIALVYLLGLLIFEEAPVALSLAAIWGLHPLLTEAVTNVVGRADLLAAFGVLGGLLCHIQNRSASGRRRLAWTLGLALAAAIGIFSKENAAVLPAVMLLYDLAWSRRAFWRERIGGYLTVAAPFASYFYLRHRVLQQTPEALPSFLDNPLIGADFWTAKLTAIAMIGKFLWLSVWPGRLSADYSYHAVPLSRAVGMIPLALCLAAAAMAIQCYRSRKPVFFWIAFVFVTLSPTANLVFFTGAIMAERFLYLPLIGVVGCAVYLVHRALPPPRLQWAVAGILCLAFGTRTFVRNFDWRDDRSLWTSAANAYPLSYKPHMGLASVLLAEGVAEIDPAVREADRSLAVLNGLPPEQLDAQPYATAAAVYRTKGDQLGAGRATEWYQKALAALSTGQQVDLAVIRQMRSLNAEHGKQVLAFGWPPVYLEFGRLYQRLSDPQKALEYLSYGRLRRPDLEFSEEMAQAWLAQGDWERAAVSLAEGLVIDPDAKDLASGMLDIYRQKAPQSCAVSNAGGQATVNLECPLVHNQVCQAFRNVALSYRQNGQMNQALATSRGAQSVGCTP